MVAIVLARSARRFLLGVAFTNAGVLGLGGLEISSSQAQTAPSTLPPVTIDVPKNQKPRRAAAPAARSHARSTAVANSRSRGTGSEPSASNVAAQGVKPNPGSDSLQPLGGQFAEPTITHPVNQSITVIEHNQIEQTSPAGLLDVLATVPGVSIARAGGIGGQIYLRGFSSNSFRSPLYVDGDRFRGRNTLQLNYFSPEEIDRVEVVRGPASVIYGSEALTGLVNIVTKEPTGDPSGPFRFTGGGWSAGYGSSAKSLSTYDWVQGAGGGFDFLGGFAGRWGGDYQTPLGRAQNSDYNAIGGSLKLGYTPALGQRWELTLRDYDEVDGRAGGVGGAPGAPYLIVRQDPNRTQLARLSYKGDLDGPVQHVEASVYANNYDTYLRTINNTINASGVATKTVTSTSHVIGPWETGGRFQGEIPWAQPGFGVAKTTFGFDGFHEDRPGSEQYSETVNRNASGVVTSVVDSPNQKAGPGSRQSDVGAFVLHEWTPVAPLTLSAGGRFDWFNTNVDTSPVPASVLPALIGHSDVDNTAPTGSVGFVYRAVPMLDLLADVATSFREPTNSELYAVSATTVPNPTLQPERGVTYEGGFRFHLPEATVKVTGFDSRYDNFLQTVPVTFNGLAGFTESQNVGKAEVSGVELEERWQATPTINFFNTFTALRGTNTLTNTPLPFLAPFRGRVGLQYADLDGSYSVLMVVDWATSKNRIDPSQEFQTSGYAIPKVYATLQLGKLISPQLGDTKLILGVENIFNTAYVDASTFANVAYPQTLTNPLLEVGRNFTAKLQHTF
ncbi:TonB-dependent receptor [Bradyrhizobium sp. dw_78]|uniref:TonB-dependent receptor n=1 Tax=Bradyrhizobium sp. dw_78 TaxID=2719793 RepID=UPI001BD33738|nr:TonB-dependent receptor [Bradyrhizobium sp. dw_78]